MISEFNEMKKKIRLLSQSNFNEFIKESPLTDIEKELMMDVRKGLSNKTLSQKYNKTISRIAQWKHSIYEKLVYWETNIIEVSDEQGTKKINIDEIISQKIKEQFKLKDEELNKKEELLNKLLKKKEKELLEQKIEQLKKNPNLNSRGTKKSKPKLFLETEKSTNDTVITVTKEELKKKYIPMYCNKEISSKEVCNILGITAQHLSRLKKNYLLLGDSSFNNKKKGHVPSNKVSEDLREQIVALYKEKYLYMSFREFSEIIINKYNIKISFSTISNILKERGIQSPTTDKYIGKNETSIGNDYLKLIQVLEKEIKKEKYSELEQFGLIQLCELCFSKAYLTLNSFSKKLYMKNFRTSYSLFNYFAENELISIHDELRYWNKNHEYFGYIYDDLKRRKVIVDIKDIYIQMFQKIKEYILTNKEKIK